MPSSQSQSELCTRVS